MSLLNTLDKQTLVVEKANDLESFLHGFDLYDTHGRFTALYSAWQSLLTKAIYKQLLA